MFLWPFYRNFSICLNFFISENEIDGEALKIVTDEDIKEMVTAIGLRKKIIKEVNLLFPERNQSIVKVIPLESQPESPLESPLESEPKATTISASKGVRKQEGGQPTGPKDDKLYENRKIYGRNNPAANLNNWQRAVNDAANSLCIENTYLVFDRANLKLLAEKKARETYCFKKKEGSRSNKVGESLSKRAKLMPDERKEKMKEIQDKLKDLEERIKLKSSLLVKARDTKDYKRCDILHDEIAKLRHDQHSMQGELKILLKKEKRATAKTGTLDNSRPLHHRDIRSLFTEKEKKVKEEAFVVSEKLIDLTEATSSQDPGSGSQEVSSSFNDHSKEQCGTFSSQGSQNPTSVNELVNSQVSDSHGSQETVTFTENLTEPSNTSASHDSGSQENPFLENGPPF